MGHMRPGDILTVTAEVVEVYGVHCVTEDSRPALLLIPYTSWIASFCSCKQFAEPGDKIKAAVRFIHPKSESIALTHCEVYEDPWANQRFVVGATFDAVAMRRVENADRCDDGPALLVRILPGAYAMLCGENSDISMGQSLSVILTEVDQRNWSVRIARCS